MAQQLDVPYLEEFVIWLQAQSYGNPRSIGDIISRLVNLNKRELQKIGTGISKNNKKGVPTVLTVWDILVSKFAAQNGPKLSYLDELMLALISRCNVDKNNIATTYGIAKGTVDNYISALCRYRVFILDKAKGQGCRTGKLTPNEEATIKNIVGGKIIFTGKQLIDIFISRLESQDRCSGQKVFFPHGLIGKIFTKHNGTKFQTIRDWARVEASEVLIHTEHGVVPVSQVEELTIDTTTGDTFIVVSGSTKMERVYNPLENGAAQKSPMLIKRISQTDIDHVIDIDTILKNLGPTLTGLQTLTNWIITAQNQLGYAKIETKNLDKIYKEIMRWSNINTLITNQLVKQIEKDLDAIANAEKLQLSSWRWNRSTKKQSNTNGSTKP